MKWIRTTVMKPPIEELVLCYTNRGNYRLDKLLKLENAWGEQYYAWKTTLANPNQVIAWAEIPKFEDEILGGQND